MIAWITGLIAALFRAWLGQRSADRAQRDAGAQNANASANAEAARTEAAIAQAAVDAPKTRDDVVNRLREGKF
jgi:hypothetical protein